MIKVPPYSLINKMHEKQSTATSKYCILPLVVTSFFLYFKNRYIDWNIGIKCAIGGIIGSVIGSILLRKLDDKILKILFTIFLIYTSIKMVI